MARAIGLLVWLAWSLAAAASGAAVELRAEVQQPLGAYIGLLDDPAGALDFPAVARADAEGRFRPLTLSATSLGHRPGATWLRFALANPTAVPQERWLHVDWIFQQSYILYLSDAEGHAERMESGTRISIARRPLASRLMLFPVRLEPGQSKTAYLRISGRAATVVDLALWQPTALLDHLALSKALKYLVLGGLAGLVTVFGFLAFQARRLPSLLALIPAHALTLLITLWMEGFPLDWLPPNDDFWLTRGVNALAFLSFFGNAVFARTFLGLPKQLPGLNRALLGLAACCLLMVGLQFVGIFPVLNHYAIVAVSSVLTWVSLLAARHRGAPGFAYLAVWGGFGLTISIQTAQRVGWFSASLPNDFWLFGLGISALAMTYALYWDVESVRLDAQAAQARLLAHEQGEAERLGRAVEEGTAELRLAMAQAEAASQAKSTFLSMISHEFRTPLHTILGYAGLLRKRAAGDLRDKLSIIEKSGTQLLGLIEDVLDFSRGERAIALAAEPVNLGALAAYLENAGRILAEKNHNRFVLEWPPDLPETVETDERRLTQVLLNLIGNACKYTQRGRIALRLARVEPGTAPERAGAAPDERHWIRFEVVDNGIGIAEAERALVFAPFSRGSNSAGRPGVGLGLAIARQIVRAMDSDIEFDSEPGRGSRFHFTLCLEEIAGEPCPSVPSWGGIVECLDARPTLLVADDIAMNRQLLSDLCGALNFDVILAADGEEAAGYCLGTDHSIAAVLVDQFMPRADGWAFLKAVRSSPSLPDLPVILVSATRPERPADFPADLDFDSILMKPVTLEQLAETLQSVLDLEWLREAPPEAQAPHSQQAALPPEKLVEFRQMLALGQVVALRRWAESLAVTHPECAELAGQVRRLSQSIDLHGLQKLLEQASAALAAADPIARRG